MQKFTNHFHYKYEKIEKICENLLSLYKIICGSIIIAIRINVDLNSNNNKYIVIHCNVFINQPFPSFSPSFYYPQSLRPSKTPTPRSRVNELANSFISLPQNSRGPRRECRVRELVVACTRQRSHNGSISLTTGRVSRKRR